MTLLAAELPRQAVGVPPERRFRPDIEGLRALAVASVVLYHAGVGWLPGGYVGVDVFFVLSGYLITGLLVREAAARGTLSVSGFYARRARRILPASMLTLLGVLVAAHFLLTDVRAQGVYTDARWAAAFLANYHFAALGTDYLQASAPPSPLQHFWSLAVEEQFYVVWPLLVLVVARLAARRWLRPLLAVLLAGLTGVSLVWSVRQTASAATTAYFSPFTRAWELGIGALLALSVPVLRRWSSRVWSWLGGAGLVAVVVSMVVYTDRTPFPGTAALLPVLGAAAVVAAGAVRPDEGVELVLRLRPFQWLGRLSYSLYLWHWPILVIAAGYVGHKLTLSQNLALVSLALLMSYVTFRLVEDPIRHWPRLVSRTSNSLAFAAAAIAATVFVANVMTSVELSKQDLEVAAAAQQQVVSFDAPEAETAAQKLAKLGPVEHAVAVSALVKKLPVVRPPLSQLDKAGSPANYDGCLVYYGGVTSPPCRYGDTTAKRVVVLFGDSHAAQWLPALAAAGTTHHFAVVALTKAGCAFPTMTVYLSSSRRGYTECNTWRSRALARIAALKPAMVVVSSTLYGVALPGSPDSDAGVDAAWAKGYPTTTDALRQAAKKVVVVGDSPVEDADPGDCLASHKSDITACSYPTRYALAAGHDDAQRSAAKKAHLPYIDVTGWFCSDTACPMVVDGMLTHFDKWHVSAVYAASLTKPFASAIGVSAWK